MTATQLAEKLLTGNLEERADLISEIFMVHEKELSEAKEQLSSLKASVLKEVEDGFDAGSEAGINHASEYYSPVQSEKEISEAKNTYLTNLKERLNIKP